jgi:hypothetical protein
MVESLIEKRKQIVRDIMDLELQLDQKRGDLIHIDNTIHVYDPDAVITDDLPKGRAHRKGKYFAHGEIQRRCLTAIREGRGEPVTIETIVIKTLTDKKLDTTNPRLRKDFYHRLFMSMQDLAKRGIVERVGARRNVKWKLAPPQLAAG